MDAGETSSCYGGGDIAGAVIGTLIGGALLAYLLFWLYTNYWKNRKGTHLVTEDPENVKQEFAFDNAGFKGDHSKTPGSAIDTKLNGVKQNSLEKRKAADDTQAGTPTPRLVSLRGSDFTGLGIEICGGLKDGIFVKKVMPQGPAANIVRIGDKITSIKIDLRHMVQEDAATILSYASPYNVQLELIDGNGVLSYSAPANSPKSSGQRSLTHPLYRSSSQEDFNTIERNARKKYPTNNSDDATNYPTLKMEQAKGAVSPQLAKNHLPVAHRENEKKSAPKIAEEKVQTRASIEAIGPDDTKKGLKFGVRVLPNISDAIMAHNEKSPSKGQAENENNSNVEVDAVVRRSSPPPISKRTKHSKVEEPSKVIPVPAPVVPSTTAVEFVRQGSINSSGIRRDAAGIPQEIPNQMMAAAMAARDHRKSASIAAEIKKNKGKAPPRPPTDDLNDTIDTDVTNLSIESTDNVDSSMTRVLNFTDNFTASDLKTPPSARKRQGSDTESQLAAYDQESDNETIRSGTQIELGSKHITVHQTSEEESEDEEHRRTASLGDLSLPNPETQANAGGNRPQNGTLERAQSLEMTEAINQKVTPKKRKAPSASAVEMDAEFNKEPRLMDMSNLDTLQRGRLKGAYEWGNLEDAIYDTPNGRYNDSHSDEDGEGDRKAASNTSLDSSFVTHVMSVADKFDKETTDENVSRQMEQLNQERNEILSKVVDDSGSSVVVIQEKVQLLENRKPKAEAFNINWDAKEATPKRYQQLDTDSPKSLEDSINNFIKSDKRNGSSVAMIQPNEFNDDDDIDNNTPPPEYNFNYKHETMPERQPVSFQYMSTEPTSSDVRLITNSSTATSTTMTSLNNSKEVPVNIKHNHTNDLSTDQVKIINYGTNMPDDVKVSRYPLGSLEHLQAAVNTKLLAQQMALDEVNHRGVVTLNTSKTTIKPDVISPSMLPVHSSPFASLLTNDPNDPDAPVFASDGQGVNSISISSMEVNIRPDSRKSDTSVPPAAVLGLENVVTISTDSRGSSQPSSIILIDDEHLDFTLRSLESDATDSPLTKNEVFIIESLSSKKVPEPKPTEAKTFITEIRVQTPNEEKTDDITAVAEKQLPPISPTTSSTPSTPSTPSPKSTSPQQSPTKKHHTDDEYGIPRNSEIRFTTATYESPSLQRLHYGGVSGGGGVIGNGRDNNRSSQIDHIRSTFERHHSQSEIPVPVRKTSIPSLRTSPSKIPVFNSTKTGGDLSRKSSNGSIHSSNGSINNNNSVSYSNNNSVTTSPLNNGHRVNVTVTSIKNSSRNPSGK